MNNSKEQIKECDYCKTSATCLCFICVNYFRDNCYKLIHDLEKNKTHKKDNIDLYVPIDIKCQFHPQIPLNLFCIEEKGKNFFFIIYK